MIEDGREELAVLSVKKLKMHFPLKSSLFSRHKRYVLAVDGVSFSVHEGEAIGLVGESGCGKSTLGKAVLRLLQPTSGSIRLLGTDITLLPEKKVRPLRRKMQMIFQDPYQSLSPRLTAGEIVAEPIQNYGLATGSELSDVVAELFDHVGMSREHMRKTPHEFSGGQRQRIGIARALALRPELIVADEAVSALDVSVQAQIINLLIELQEEFGIAYLFIAHDLAVVEHISHRVAVMYLGKIVEFASTADLFDDHQHPYTEALMAAAPSLHPDAGKVRHVLEGDIPSPIAPPRGCRFHTRCPLAVAACSETEPELVEIKPDHFVACHLRTN